MTTAISIPASSLSNTVSFAVPAGFRQVIEYVSGSARVGDKDLVRVNVAMSASGTCGPTPGCPIVSGSWRHYCFFWAVHCPMLTQEAMFIDPEA